MIFFPISKQRRTCQHTAKLRLYSCNPEGGFVEGCSNLLSGSCLIGLAIHHSGITQFFCRKCWKKIGSAYAQRWFLISFLPSADNAVTMPSFVSIPANPGVDFLEIIVTTSSGAVLLAELSKNMVGNIVRNLSLKGFFLVPSFSLERRGERRWGQILGGEVLDPLQWLMVV